MTESEETPAPPPVSPPLIVDDLDLDSLPAGEITRLLVAVAHDGLGRPLRMPVLVARGARPGPVFGLTAAVHGNELNGIPVIHELFAKLEPAKMRGTVVAVVVVNVPAYLARRRTFTDGTDLNHIMPGRADGSAAQAYAARFVERTVRHFDYLIDLHTASTGRVNSLYARADMTNETTAAMAYLQRPQIIVHNRPSDGTLRGTAMAMGIPAITVEIGNPQRIHQGYVRSSLVGIRAVLAEVGILARRPVALGDPPVVCRRSEWLYTTRGGLLTVLPEVVGHVAEGELVAELRDVFGDVVEQYRAPYDAIVVGRSVDPVAETGARVVHLGLIGKPRGVHQRDSSLAAIGAAGAAQGSAAAAKGKDE